MLLMTVGSKRQVILKKIEVGVFNPSGFNKGKTLEEMEIELAIKESLEYDQRNRLINGEDKWRGVSHVSSSSSSSSSSCYPIVDVIPNPRDVDLIEVICLIVYYYFFLYIDFCLF